VGALKWEILQPKYCSNGGEGESSPEGTVEGLQNSFPPNDSPKVRAKRGCKADRIGPQIDSSESLVLIGRSSRILPQEKGQPKKKASD
jgi:hypothetical protein